MKIVIFGANEVGCLLATELFEDHDIIVIDKEENRLNDFQKLDISFIQGNGSNLDVLLQAQIKEADVFIACTNIDEGNIFACLTVKKISDAKTVCFISKEETLESLSLIKSSEYQECLLIDKIIWPEEILTEEIFRIITIPQAIRVENFADEKARLTEYRIKENSKIINKKIKDCNFPNETLIVGITRDNHLFIPDGETILELNDKIIFMGSVGSLEILASLFFTHIKTIKNASIIGGGSVGSMLAKKFENIGIKTKLIEQDYKQCEILSELLKNTLILYGDGSNIELLKQEDIGSSEVLISVTNNDEKNLLCSLLAKQLGVEKVITRVSKATNVCLFEKVGIDVAVSPRGSAINEIIHTVIENGDGILTTVEQGLGAILKFTLNKEFKDIKIMDLKLPRHSLIAIIQRGNRVIIPKGDTLVRSLDKLIVFTTEDNSDNVKEFFKTKI